MGIREMHDFRIKATIEDAEATPRIVLKNTRTGKQCEVVGKVLEAQYGIDDKALLFVTEGNPFEEALYIYYLDGELKILDVLELSAMYAEGILDHVTLLDPDSISFSFFEQDERWVLRVLSEPGYAFLENRHPVKRRTSILARRWLKLRKS